MARRRSGKKIDFVHWTYNSGSFAALSAGTVAATYAAAVHEPETLLRIRGNLTVFADGLGAPGRLASVGVGLILVPEGTGATVLWSPITDGDAPWIWVDYAHIGHEELVADVIAVEGLSLFRSVIDNKAMRIVRNQELQLVAENATILSALNVNVVMDGRVLSGK